MKSLYEIFKDDYDELNKIVNEHNSNQAAKKKLVEKFVPVAKDNRTNSALFEKYVQSYLEEEYGWIPSEKDRTFGDILLPTDFEVDIKVVSSGSNTNLCTFEKGLNYIFFNEKRINDKVVFSRDFLTKIQSLSISDFVPEKDFAFLFVDKATAEMRWSSFLSLDNFVINHSNGIQASINDVSKNIYQEADEALFTVMSGFKEFLLPHLEEINNYIAAVNCVEEKMNENNTKQLEFDF